MPSNSHDNQPGQSAPGEEQINIQIDRVHYRVHTDSANGEQLRQLVTPPIPMDRDLFRVVPAGDDIKIELTTVVALQDGMRFFTVPTRINPGNRGDCNGTHD